MTARSMWRSIVQNPANRGQRVRRIWLGAVFQARGRLTGRPTRVPVGRKSSMWAYVDSWGSKAVAYANPPDPEMLVWQRVLRPGDLFVDVGANVGAYTLWALDVGAHVIAVEPDGHARDRLVENLTLNGYDAETAPAALLDQPGAARFSTGRDTLNQIGTEGVEVEVTTLDQVIGDRYAAGVKVDVEGFERLVLEGAQQALAHQRIGMLQIEWNHLSIPALGETRQPIVRLLRDAGYSVQRPLGTEIDTEDFGPDVFAMPARDNRRLGPGSA